MRNNVDVLLTGYRYPFNKSSLLVMITFYWSVSTALIAFAYCIASLFSSARVASLITPLIYALSMIPGLLAVTTQVCSSASVLDEISVRSPQKSFIFIIFKKKIRIKVSQKNIQFWNWKHWCAGHQWFRFQYKMFFLGCFDSGHTCWRNRHEKYPGWPNRCNGWSNIVLGHAARSPGNKMKLVYEFP